MLDVTLSITVWIAPVSTNISKNIPHVILCTQEPSYLPLKVNLYSFVTGTNDTKKRGIMQSAYNLLKITLKAIQIIQIYLKIFKKNLKIFKSYNLPWYIFATVFFLPKSFLSFPWNRREGRGSIIDNHYVCLTFNSGIMQKQTACYMIKQYYKLYDLHEVLASYDDTISTITG